MCMLSHFSCIKLFVTLWTVACQIPLSLGFTKQEHWSGLLCHLPGDLHNPEIEPVSLVPPSLASRFFTSTSTWKAHVLFSQMHLNSKSPWQLLESSFSVRQMAQNNCGYADKKKIRIELLF